MEKARAKIAQLHDSKTRIGVAVSGGGDSMCLLHLLLSDGAIDNARITVINVEHGIRGDSSVSDSEFVKSYAMDNGLNFLGYSLNVPKLAHNSGNSVETEARLQRKRIFRELIEDNDLDIILTAHHAEDRRESQLMHLLRGCGVAGLVGTSERSDYIFRPLIDTDKSAITNYLTENAVPYVTDETNQDNRYNRNFIRNELLPLLNARYNVSAALDTLAKSASEDEQFILSQLDTSLITKISGGVLLNLAALSAPTALANRYILLACAQAGLVVDVERTHIDAVRSLVNKQSGKRVDLVHGYTASKQHDGVLIATPQTTAIDEVIEEIEIGLTPFGDGYITITPTDNTLVRGVTKLDGDKIIGAIIRTRRDGDEFTPYGGKTKKLKQYFIDNKIPLRERDKLPLICVGNKVLCIIGVQIADSVKITNETKSAMLVSYTED